MPRQRESIGELLLKMPWWVSASLGLLTFALLRWGLPAWAGQDNARRILANGFTRLAPLVLLPFAMLAVGSFLFARKRHRLLGEQANLETLRATPWKDFEYLVAEAYRRQGYRVEYSLGRGADGGVDLALHKDGQKALVQCKQWKVFSVGAPVVRETFGLMTAEQADQAVIVTSGNFTRDAQDFAAGKPIRLIDGPELLTLVQSVRTKPTAVQGATTPSFGAPSPPACPRCGKPMVHRVARRGSNAGSQFWGCSAYPACKGTRTQTPPLTGAQPE